MVSTDTSLLPHALPIDGRSAHIMSCARHSYGTFRSHVVKHEVMCVCVCVCVCVCACVCVCVCSLCISVLKVPGLHTYVSCYLLGFSYCTVQFLSLQRTCKIFICTYVRTYMCTYVHIYIRMHIRTYVHTYTLYSIANYFMSQHPVWAAKYVCTYIVMRV